MATVYRARDRRLDREVAIKVLDGAEPATSAWREDRITARVDHPNVVGVYDSGATPDGRSFLVMELIAGEPVSRLAPLPPARALAIAEDVAAAIAYAHEQGVIHCDLKPQNVLLDSFGRARLTDFGVASADNTPVGAAVYGSASYIPPERLRGAPASPAVDIYALGALLYYLIVGRPPYAGASAAAIVAQVRSGPPPPLALLVPGAGPAVEAIVRRAMAPEPADRYPSAAAVRDALATARRTLEARPAAPLPTGVAGMLGLAAPLRTVPALVRAGARRLGRPEAAWHHGRAALAAAWTGLGFRARVACALLLLVGALFVAIVPRVRDDETAAASVAAVITPVSSSPVAAPAAPSPPPSTLAPVAPIVAPVPAGAASRPVPAGPVEVEVAISDPAPPRSARMTVTATLRRGGVGVAGVPLRSVWHFRSGDSTCRGSATDAGGRSSCTLSMGGATAGYPVVVEVFFDYDGQTYRGETTFVPR